VSPRLTARHTSSAACHASHAPDSAPVSVLCRHSERRFDLRNFVDVVRGRVIGHIQHRNAAAAALNHNALHGKGRVELAFNERLGLELWRGSQGRRFDRRCATVTRAVLAAAALLIPVPDALQQSSMRALKKRDRCLMVRMRVAASAGGISARTQRGGDCSKRHHRGRPQCRCSPLPFHGRPQQNRRCHNA
jgi:hypothetical protein